MKALLDTNIIIHRENTKAEFSLSIDPKTTDETEKSFLPKVAGQKCYIPFLLGGKNFSFGDFMKSDDSESFCMEIPFIVLFETGMHKFDRIAVIRG